jgi:hypothetical protein
MIQLPITNEGLQRLSTVLGSTEYIVEMFYNTFANSWFFSLYDAEDVPLLNGVRVVTAWPLFFGFPRENLPEGELMLIKLDGTDTDPVMGDFGVNAALYYLEPEDV